MSATAVRTVSPEVEEHIAVLSANSRRSAEVVPLLHARVKNQLKRTVKQMEATLSDGKAASISFKIYLRDVVLPLVESKWGRADLARYRGVFVENIQATETAIPQMEEVRNNFNSDSNNYKDAHTRRFARAIDRTSRDSIGSYVELTKRHLQFKKEILLRVDRRLRELNEPLSLSESFDDIAKRYPTVTEYLAR